MRQWVNGKEFIVPPEYVDRRNLQKAYYNGFMCATIAVTTTCPRRYEANPPMAAAYRRGYEACRAATIDQGAP